MPLQSLTQHCAVQMIPSTPLSADDPRLKSVCYNLQPGHYWLPKGSQSVRHCYVLAALARVMRSALLRGETWNYLRLVPDKDMPVSLEGLDCPVVFEGMLQDQMAVLLLAGLERTRPLARSLSP